MTTATLPAVKHQHKSQRASAIQNYKKMFVENTNEFCINTTLHGLKYVVDKQLYYIERLFFAISFVLVVVVSGFFISNVYSKWRTTPVILSLNPIPTVVSEVPFPAVTICNLNQAVKSKVRHFKTNTLEYAMLQTICQREVNMTVAKTMDDWNRLEEFIVNISQPCTSLLLRCRFGAVYYNCSDIFRPIVTDAGLCCVFNMVHPKFMYIPEVSNILNISYSDGSEPVDWDPEHGYPSKLPEKYYPRTAAGTGEYLGFTVTLDVEAKEYYCSSSNGIGFKIFLHSPTETPHVKDVGLFMAAGTENKLRINARKFETDLNLRSMDKRYRQCLFDSEGDLIYFSYYTKRNCEMECLTRMIMKYCGCVAHYMPKMYTNGSICGIQHVQCVEKYRRLSMLNDESSYDCQDLCWASCFDLTFDPDIFTIPISHDGFSVEDQLVQNMSSKYASENIGIAHIFFKENTFRSSRQTEFIGTTDFLSSTGGLMGLFMGFSFISLAEFIYYACMRPYYNIRRTVQARRIKPVVNGRTACTRHLAMKTLKQRFRNHFGTSKRMPNKNQSSYLYAKRKAVEQPLALSAYYGLDVPMKPAKRDSVLIRPMNNH